MLSTGCPALAGAAQVSVDAAMGRLDINDFAGQTNVIVVTAEPGSLVVTDTGVAPTAVGTGCTPQPPNAVRCDSLGVAAISALLGNGDDSLRVDESVYTVASVIGAVIQGQGGNDVLVSGSGTDLLLGGTGNDSLSGGPGDDTLRPQDGDDTVAGGPGNDDIRGEAGNDTLSGNEGEDLINGGPGADIVAGGPGNDDVSGGVGDDVVRGDDGNDRLDMDPADLAEQNRGSDAIEGGAGDDTLGGGSEANAADPDSFSGGDGRDTVDYSSRVSPLVISLDGSANDGSAGERDDVRPDVEHVVGGSDSDTITGSAGDDELDGGPGRDLLSGLGGNDTLQGGADAGSDSLLGGAGRDVLIGGEGDDSLDGGADDDALSGGGGSDTLVGGGGQDALLGGPGLDSLQGGDGNDMLNGADIVLIGADGADALDGGAGNDVLLGGPGDDRLDGGPGADQMSGEDGRDTVSYQDRTARITVTFDDVANDGEAGEDDNVASDVENVVGGTVSDTLSGDARANVLDAGSGDDYVNGGAGPDMLVGGKGIDVLRARDGTRDVVVCGDGVDLAIVDRFDTFRDCDYVDRGRRRRPPLGRAALVRPVRGSVKLRLPGASRFVPLRDSVEVPLRSTLDASAGAANVVTTKRRGGTVQEASFRGGAFSVDQRRIARPVTELRLTGGDFAACRVSGGGRTNARVRLLWTRIGKQRGKYRVRGEYSLGAAYGTTWLTEDRCDGTLTQVVTGAVRVRDFGRHRTAVVHAGDSYLARATRPGGRAARPRGIRR